MKTLYITNSDSNILIDKDTEEVDVYNNNSYRYSIRAIKYIDQPMHIVYGFGETHEELDAKKGDILVQFVHNKRNKKNVILVKNKDWAANIQAYLAEEQRAKEEWAAKQLQLKGNECEDESSK